MLPYPIALKMGARDLLPSGKIETGFSVEKGVSQEENGSLIELGRRQISAPSLTEY